jgi:hypothetical protein
MEELQRNEEVDKQMQELKWKEEIHEPDAIKLKHHKQLRMKWKTKEVPKGMAAFQWKEGSLERNGGVETNHRGKETEFEELKWREDVYTRTGCK